MEANKALHHHLTGQRPHDRRGEPRRDQAQTEDGCRRMAQQRFEGEIRFVEVSNAGVPVEMERRSRRRHHRQVNKTSNGHGNCYVPARRVIALFRAPAVQMLSQ